MAQSITLSVVSISNDIPSTGTFTISEPGGATCTPSSCTKAQLQSNLVVVVDSDTANSLVITSNSGACSGIATDTVTWTVINSTPTPTPTQAPPTPTPTSTPTPTPTVNTPTPTATPTPTPTVTPTPAPSCFAVQTLDGATAEGACCTPRSGTFYFNASTVQAATAYYGNSSDCSTVSPFTRYFNVGGEYYIWNGSSMSGPFTCPACP